MASGRHALEVADSDAAAYPTDGEEAARAEEHMADSDAAAYPTDVEEAARAEEHMADSDAAAYPTDDEVLAQWEEAERYGWWRRARRVAAAWSAREGAGATTRHAGAPWDGRGGNDGSAAAAEGARPASRSRPPRRTREEWTASVQSPEGLDIARVDMRECPVAFLPIGTPFVRWHRRHGYWMGHAGQPASAEIQLPDDSWHQWRIQLPSASRSRSPRRTREELTAASGQ